MISLLKVWRLMKEASAGRRRLALRAQRRRLVRSLVASDLRRKGLR